MKNYSIKKEDTEYSPGEKFYTCKVATQYETLRQNDRYWAWEDEVLDYCLRTFRVDQRIADCPLGTGRFINIYAKHGLQVFGVDISRDMLNEASKKVLNTSLEGKLELIQTDVSTLTLDHPVAKALVCFRLLHLISDKRLNDVVRGLATISSEYIFLQVFSVHDFNFRRVAERVAYAIISGKSSYISKLKYVYRTFRDLTIYRLRCRSSVSANRHEKNTLCDITYAHPLARILTAFAQNGFIMKDSIDCRDNTHLIGESGCYLSMVVVLQKEQRLVS